MSSPAPVDLVAYLIKYGRSRDFSVKQPYPEKGKLMYNSHDGKIYYGNKDNTGWEVYSSPSPHRIIFEKDPAVEKTEKAEEAASLEKQGKMSAEYLQAQTRLHFQQEAARRVAAGKSAAGKA